MRAPILILALLALVPGSVAQADPSSPSLAAVEASAAPAPDPAGVRLHIERPVGGSLVESKMHMAEIRGSATHAGGQPKNFDVMIAIDVSQSTKAASGADVDEDGEIGENPHEGLFLPGEYPDDVWSTDPDDTILAAEVRAARALLESVDSKRVRVGLLTFSGQVNLETGRQISRNQRDAKLEVALTQDYDRVRRALDDVGARPPRGATNFAAGIRLATQELAGLSGAVSSAAPDAKKVILFLTDGFPTFPAGQATVSDPGDLEAAVNAARVAQAAGIRKGHTRHLHAGARARWHRRDTTGGLLRQHRGRGCPEPDYPRVRARRASQSRRRLRGIRSGAGGKQPGARQRARLRRR
jgi:hypothetical protein